MKFIEKTNGYTIEIQDGDTVGEIRLLNNSIEQLKCHIALYRKAKGRD